MFFRVIRQIRVQKVFFLPHTTYIALGTNLGDRQANLQAALSVLPPQVRVTGQSHIYETEPWGYADQPAFLNMVIRAETELTPDALLSHLKGLEQTLGRQPGFRNGPRIIDLDILFYDDLVLETPPLVIPHPRLHERSFVLVPMADLDPDHIHPVIGETIWMMLTNVDIGGIRLFAKTE